MEARPRTWGIWTEHKLDILKSYLPEFTTASRSAPATVYLDLFCGDDSNVSRTTGLPIDGSARVALQCRPAFSRVILFDLPGPLARLRTQVEHHFPTRDVSYFGGDCNARIDEALECLRGFRLAPTFAFVDPYAAEIEWRTLEKLAAHKADRSPTKVEMWLLFPHAQLPRGLRVTNEAPDPSFSLKTSRLFGCSDWMRFDRARREGVLSAEAFRDELVNLMRWRLENDLGYKRTHALEVHNPSGVPIYTMIFVTDSVAGDRIMTHIYRKASERFPGMRAAAVAQREAEREARSGTEGLFPPLPREPKRIISYEHEPPWPPESRLAVGHWAH